MTEKASSATAYLGDGATCSWEGCQRVGAWLGVNLPFCSIHHPAGREHIEELRLGFADAMLALGQARDLVGRTFTGHVTAAERRNLLRRLALALHRDRYRELLKGLLP